MDDGVAALDGTLEARTVPHVDPAADDVVARSGDRGDDVAPDEAEAASRHEHP